MCSSPHSVLSPHNPGHPPLLTPDGGQGCSGNKLLPPLSYPHPHGLHQEYERTVIFRLGRLLSGGARGPGVFFIIPCVDIFEKIDLRVQNFDVPPQEVILDKISVQ